MAQKEELKTVPSVNEEIRRHVDAVLRTEAGRALWVHLFRACGYNVSSLTRKIDGDVSVLTTECKEAQRLVYIDLRRLASRELLAAAETLAETPVAIPTQIKNEERKN